VSTVEEASSRPAFASEVADSRDNADPSRRLRSAKHSSDSELVVRALQTLRRENDPAEAARLLERYRARNPSGVLAEEVLSLQIEAALAGVDPRAHAFAREYLSRYPEGRYRERAARALAAGAP
jgi:outer membrane protein assembly factor BamD (BamD/ComL family)